MKFKSYFYFVSNSIKSWHEAQAYCKGLGGELVKINSEEENGFVLKLVHKRAPSVKQVWIGLRWNACVRGFIWSDLSIPKYTSWAPLEPNGKAREPCGNMWTGRATNLPFHAPGYWNDCNCQTLVHTPCGLVCKSLAEPDCDGKLNPGTSEYDFEFVTASFVNASLSREIKEDVRISVHFFCSSICCFDADVLRKPSFVLSVMVYFIGFLFTKLSNLILYMRSAVNDVIT